MKLLILFISSAIVTLQYTRIYAQEKEELIQQRIEFLSEQAQNEELDLSNLLEALRFYYDHPLNLNQASLDELQELSLLNDWQIQSLLLHIRSHGKLISIYELQGLNYWDLSTIDLVLPFVYVDDKLEQIHVRVKEVLKYASTELLARYQVVPEKKMGYTPVSDSLRNLDNTYYFGNSGHYYTRFRFYYRTNMSIGITAEKDPGEQFFRGDQKSGFDFYSGHLFFKGGKYIKALSLGDYQVQIGQGLQCWTGYGFGKTADVLTSKKSAVALRPYTSADEFNFFRGAAIDCGFDNFSWLNFLSIKNLDASVEINENDLSTQRITSITPSGLHRTRAELDKRGVLTEKIFGSNFRYSSNSFSVGISSIYRNYTSDFAQATQVYNQFSSVLRNNFTIGADYRIGWKNTHLFGENVFQPESNAWANINGLLVSLDAKCVLSLIYRNYGRAYVVPYANGFSESSKVQNEEGLFGGLKVKFNQFWSIQGYYDFFRFPWLKYQVDAPSLGNDYLLQVNYKPNKKMELYARYRNEMHQENYDVTNHKLPQVGNTDKHNFRLNWSLIIGEAITLRNRVEYTYIKKPQNPQENGVLVYQDFIWKPKKSPFELFVRYALFDTQSYDSRLYSYENNALYLSSIPAYYYQGNRFVGMLKYTFLKYFDVWFRYGISLYDVRSSVGSGSEEIVGNRKSDVTIQLRVKL